MDGPTPNNVVVTTSKVAGYGGAVASVLTNYSIGAKKVPRGIEGMVNMLTATVATLQQVASHLKTEVVSATDEHEKQVLSRPGLEYVQLLATECAATFVRIAPIVADACLDCTELSAKRKVERKALAKNAKTDDLDIDIDALELDTAVFTENIENAKWICAARPLDDVMQRLHEIQLHLLLVHQVILLGQLSWIGTSNQVDIKSVVAYHERVLRTAGLIGIKAPDQHATNRRHGRYTSSGSDSVTDSDSQSDLNSNASDSSDYSPKNPRKTSPESIPPPPPPPGFRGGSPPPPLVHPAARAFLPSSPPPANWPGGPLPSTVPAPAAPRPGSAQMTALPAAVCNSARPPAYSEAQGQCIVPYRQSPNSASSTFQATVMGPTNLMITAPQDASVHQSSVSPPEKEASKDVATPAPLEPRLFRSNTNGIGFKIKTFFRSKNSLGEEMKRALSDSDSCLQAFVLRGHETRLVPHSAFHTLEATHMRTILSQLNDNTWYRTFTTLNPAENQSMARLIHPFVLGQVHERNVVVLKVIEENKPSAWLVLLRDLLKTHPAPHGSRDRLILAIMREKLIDGEPLTPMSFGTRGMPAPPPPFGPPFGFGGPPIVPAIRPLIPPTSGPPNRHRMTWFSDLAIPAPPLPMPCSLPPPPFCRGPPGAPPLLSTNLNFGARSTIRLSDTRPLTEHDADLALTTYSEYTLRLRNPADQDSPRTWSRALVTQESTEHALLRSRVADFTSRGGNIIETKLRLNENQNRQLTRIMDELQAFERDAARFEWCWAEISLYGEGGEMALISQANSGAANTMHGIAKRSLRKECQPVEVYNSFMRPPLQWQQMVSGPPTPPPPPPPAVSSRVEVVPRRRMAAARRRGGSGYRDSSSGFDSDSSLGESSSDGVGGLRMVMRRDRERKIQRKVVRERTRMRMRRIMRRNGSDTESESESESEEDVIQVKVDLKRGDDVARVLLDLWTVQGERSGEVSTEEKGKGKGKSGM